MAMLVAVIAGAVAVIASNGADRQIIATMFGSINNIQIADSSFIFKRLCQDFILMDADGYGYYCYVAKFDCSSNICRRRRD